METTGKRLVIVTGANGAVGRSYIEHFIQEKDTSCIAISRGFMDTKATHYKADLMDPVSTRKAVEQFDLSDVSIAILIHAVGKFKYEPNNDKKEEKVIDEEVYSSNYQTFLNIASPLVERVEEEHKKQKKTSLVLCAFGSITDKYKIPFWHSYTSAKNDLREYIKTLAESESWQGLVRGRFINVSTTDTGNENLLRPNATEEEKKYWLKPFTVVEESKEAIEQIFPVWQEIDIFVNMPGFSPEEYYGNNEKIKAKWMKQTGYIKSEK